MGDNSIFALRDVSLSIQQGDFVAIMGPSGSGKSTLAHILGLLDVPSSGSYQLGGKEVSALSEDELAVLRRDKIGFIFQQFNLLPRMSALENVILPLFYSKRNSDPEYSFNLLKRVNLETRMSHRPNELSGGQQQRVAIARSLVNRPHIILADEPTGNLDSVSEKEILNILKELNSQGITIIMVTHEEDIGKQAKRLIRMRDGSIHSDERIMPLPENPQKNPIELSQMKTVQQGLSSEVLEHFYQGYKTLLNNKIRTMLSVLGILIGVGAVVAMMAIGHGAQKDIQDQLSSLGSNLLVLRSGVARVGGVVQEGGSPARLYPEDAIVLKERIPTINEVGPKVDGRGQVTYLNKNWNTQIIGSSPTYTKMRDSHPEMGRFFTAEENQKRARVAVIGATLVHELFPEKNPIGEMIKINKISFQVIGVLPEKGANSWRDQDDIVIVPLLTAMYRLLGKSHVESIDIEVRDSQSMEFTQEAVLNLMSDRRKIPPAQREDAFRVRNMADIQAAVSQTSKTMSMLLASIAAISLLVGGIGIMNIMLVSVTERTKEIGLRKAIGARRRDILLQFLAESIVISVTGGLLGITLGQLISTLLSLIAGWNTTVTWQSVLLAFSFSAFIGILFGIYPARKASLLHPIVALRYE